MNLKKICENLESELVAEHAHKPSTNQQKLTEMAIEARRNFSVGPLRLFMAWVEENTEAKAVLEARGLKWE